jgi:hypothetical protein
MKTSFAKPASKPATKPVATAKPAPQEEAVEETSESTLAVRESSEVAMPIQGMDGQIQGEFSRRDLTIPKLNLVNKTGELSNTFPAGSFLYNREVVIGDGKKPCPITITRMAKFYLQDLPYGSGEMPKNFSTLRDVRAAGGALANDPEAEEGVDRYSEAMTCIVLVKSPEKNHALFPFEYNGEFYALAQWLLTKSAYKQTGRKLFTDSQLALRAGVDTASYELTSSIRTNSQGSWYVPVVKLGAKHDEKFVEFVRSITS